MVFETLSKKFILRIAVHNKSGRKKNELREEVEEWIENFLDGKMRHYVYNSQKKEYCLRRNGRP